MIKDTIFWCPINVSPKAKNSWLIEPEMLLPNSKNSVFFVSIEIYAELLWETMTVIVYNSLNIISLVNVRIKVVAFT